MWEITEFLFIIGIMFYCLCVVLDMITKLLKLFLPYGKNKEKKDIERTNNKLAQQSQKDISQTKRDMDAAQFEAWALEKAQYRKAQIIKK